MPDESNDSFRRFARDLRRVREDRGVSLSTVQDATQVHESHLESFESGTLYEESRMNDIYLKAFVRAYAKAVGLTPETVINHLETALEDEYDDQLLQAFLQRPSEEGSREPDDSSAEEAPSPSSLSTSSAPEASQKPSQGRDEDRASDRAPASSSAQSGSADGDGTAPSRPRSDTPSDIDEAPDVAPPSREKSDGGEDAPPQTASDRRSSEGQRPDSPQRSASRSKTSSTSRPRSGTLMAAGLVLLLVLGGLGLYLMGGDGPGSESAADRPPSADASMAESSGPSPDTTVSDTADGWRTPDRPPRATVSLGDTLYAAVVATADVLELRVQQDAKLRRPYWIEDGGALVFPFTDRITLQNQLDNFQLLLEGYPYPTSRTDESGRVVIDRGTAEQFADTLRGGPSPIPAQRDTAWGDAPELDTDTLQSDT